MAKIALSPAGASAAARFCTTEKYDTPFSATEPVSVILCDAEVCTPLTVFPAARLGAFLRAMLDPEGGVLDAVDESVVRRIERRVEEATRA